MLVKSPTSPGNIPLSGRVTLSSSLLSANLPFVPSLEECARMDQLVLLDILRLKMIPIFPLSTVLF
jgi:hypothetical protein